VIGICSIIPPLCGKVLLDQHVAPVERFEERPNQLLFGLRLGRCSELPEAGKKRVEPVSQTIQCCVVEPLPSDFIPDPFDEEITRKKPTVQQCAAPRQSAVRRRSGTTAIT
jgi:hypothetical protein